PRRVAARRACGARGHARGHEAPRQRDERRLGERAHARRGRGDARRAAARDAPGCHRRRARAQGARRGAAARGGGGLRMPRLSNWHELPSAGTVSPAEAVQPTTGDWRTAGKPVLLLDACINCLLCWLYCPDSAVLLEGTTIDRID